MKNFSALIMTLVFLGVIASVSYASTITIHGTIPQGKVGQNYSATFSATSTATSHIKDWKFRGTIPGLTFSGFGYSATLLGTPSASGRFSCSITVTDNNGNRSDPFQFTVVIGERNSNNNI